MRDVTSVSNPAVAVFAPILLLAGAAGCGSDALGPFEQRQLNQARSRWDGAAIGAYQMEVRVGCFFCPAALPDFTRVEVRDDRVVAADTPDSSEPPLVIPLEEWPTVEDAFARIESASESDDYDSIAAEYDPELGYPTRIDLSCPPDVLDCGYRLELRSLKPIEPAP